MSAVIEFPLSRIGSGSRNESAASAEIVIFPGVRIDRQDFSLADRLPPPRLRPGLPIQAKEIENL